MPESTFDLINILLTLLEQWVNSEFPLPRQKTDISRLNVVWRNISIVMSNSTSLKEFDTEIAKIHAKGHGGDPTIFVFKQRLEELIRANLRDFFLVVSVRIALEQQISRQFPDRLQSWVNLADEVLPVKLMFARRDEEMGFGNKTR